MRYERRLEPMVKWPGGKSEELPVIHAAMPKTFDRFYEPFVGGGAVWLSVDAPQMFVNDASGDLIGFYRAVQSQSASFFRQLARICDLWDTATSAARALDASGLRPLGLSSSPDEARRHRFAASALPGTHDLARRARNNAARAFASKARQIGRLRKDGVTPDLDNLKDLVETALKTSIYMALRDRLNGAVGDDGERAADWFAVRTYCYSAMFRYSRGGTFNVPYGGMSYNRKSLRDRVDAFRESRVLDHLRRTQFFHADFLDFFRAAPPGPSDFVFLDPPYDTTFSTYDRNAFGAEDQCRLAEALCNECKAKWLMIVNDSPLIRSLYARAGIFLTDFDKTYRVSFMNRNVRKARHLLITNYRLDAAAALAA